MGPCLAKHHCQNLQTARKQSNEHIQLYMTMPEGIMGNGGSWVLIEALGVSAT